MFKVNEDLSIDCTRGDAGTFSVGAKLNEMPYTFRAGDIVRLTVCAKKDYSTILLQKDVEVEADTEFVEIHLDSTETKMGEVINKVTECWYTIELNPETYCQTIIGHGEDGAAIFRLYPEADAGGE